MRDRTKKLMHEREDDDIVSAPIELPLAALSRLGACGAHNAMMLRYHIMRNYGSDPFSKDVGGLDASRVD